MLYARKDWSMLRRLVFGNAVGGGGGSLTEYEVEGNPAVFNTNVAKNLTGLVVPFTPIQEGEGDPSPENIRPITGITGMNVSRTGKNLWDITVYDGGSYNPNVGTKFNLKKSTTQWTDNGDGTFSLSFGSTWTYKTLIIPVVPGNTYYRYLKIKQSGNRRESHGAMDENFTITSNTNTTTSGDITFSNTLNPAKAKYYYHVLTNASSSNITITIENPMINIGSTREEYEPYVGTTIPITFPAVGKNKFLIQEFANSYEKYSTSNVGRLVLTLEPNTQYTVSTSIPGTSTKYCFAWSGGIEGSPSSNTNGVAVNAPRTITSDDDGQITIGLYFQTGSHTYQEVLDGTYYVQVESGSSATSYEPYTNTVYGGELDVLTGELTVEYGKIVKNTSNMNGYSEDMAAWVEGAGIKALVGEGINSSEYDIYSDKGNKVTINTVSWRDNLYLPQNGNNLTQSEWKALATDVTFIARLAEPIVYQLTPQQIQTLIGDNVIFSDTNGENTIKYLKKG